MRKEKKLRTFSKHLTSPNDLLRRFVLNTKNYGELRVRIIYSDDTHVHIIVHAPIQYKDKLFRVEKTIFFDYARVVACELTPTQKEIDDNAFDLKKKEVKPQPLIITEHNETKYSMLTEWFEIDISKFPKEQRALANVELAPHKALLMIIPKELAIEANLIDTKNHFRPKTFLSFTAHLSRFLDKESIAMCSTLDSAGFKVVANYFQKINGYQEDAVAIPISAKTRGYRYDHWEIVRRSKQGQHGV